MSEPTGFHWWHAALILVGANTVSTLPAGFGSDFAFYNSFRQPTIAPPAWAFAPVWLFLRRDVSRCPGSHRQRPRAIACQNLVSVVRR